VANGESSTSPSNETVSLKLPSGEMVDAIVPAGLNDDQVRLIMRMKRPDLLATSPRAGMSLPESLGAPAGQAGVPQGLQGQSLQQRFPIVPQQDEDFSQTMQRAAQAGKTVTPEELQGQAIQGAKMAPAVLAGAGAMGAVGAAALAGPGEVPGVIGQAATKAIPYVKGIGTWAEAHPQAAKALIELVKYSGYLGTGYAALKKAAEIGSAGAGK
jgi:hypothetical protein